MSEGFGVSAWGQHPCMESLGPSRQQQNLHGYFYFRQVKSKISVFPIPINRNKQHEEGVLCNDAMPPSLFSHIIQSRLFNGGTHIIPQLRVFLRLD
jgi:hypothetical protein